MFWRKGWFLNSLGYQVEKNLQETLYQSEAYQKYKWNVLERQVVAWSKKPIYYLSLIILSVLMLSISANFLEGHLYSLKSGYLYRWAWVYGWQSTLLSAQLTLIGVVFPLVIGLVGFLLQKKTASKAIWSLYKNYSGFLFTGFSGLALSIFIIISQYLETLFPLVSYTLLCMVSAIWLSFNIVLSGWFLWATFQIIQESSRDELLLKFTINESFVQNIRERLSLLIPQNVLSNKLINLPDDIMADISTIRFSRDLETVYSSNFKRPVYIANIYFRILDYVINSLLKRSKDAGLDEKPQLVIPATVDNKARKEHVVATSIGFSLNSREKLLLKLSYRFSIKQPFDAATLDEIIYSLVGSASDELKSRNPKLFDKAIKRLARWHCAVSDSLAFKNDENKLDSWLLLPSSSYLSRSFLDELLSEYYLLTKQAVSKIPETTEYFDDMVNLHLKIHNWNKEPLPEKVVNELIHGSYLCWTALIQWSAVIDKPIGSSLYNQYENALLSYVGAWESWPIYLEPRSVRWKDTIDSVPNFIHYLRCTGQQVVTAIRHEDVLAAEWAADMLIHWSSNISLHRHPQGQYRWKHELITPNILYRNCTDGLWHFILNQNPYEERAATQLAMDNAWLDIRIICACYIASKPATESSDLPMRVASALLKGSRFRPTGTVERRTNSIRTGADILSAYIRQRCYWDSDGGNYGQWLNSIVDVFNRIDDPKRVSGRIYTGWGANDVRSLDLQYVKFSIMYSDRTWTLSQRWVEILFSEFVEKHHRHNLISDLNVWLQLVEQEIDIDDVCTEEKINNFKLSLEKVISLITARNIDEIKSAKIDDGKLTLFGLAASTTGFQKKTGGLLLGLFKNVKYTAKLMTDSQLTLNINGYPKSEISSGINSDFSGDDGGWLDEAINQHVSENLFVALDRQDSSIEASFELNSDLLLRVSADIRARKIKGEDSIFFVGPWGIHQLLSEISYNLDQSLALNVERRNGFENEYVCHLEGCPVYELPNGFGKDSFLVSKNIFDTVTFYKFEEDRYIDVGYKDLDVETLKLTLVLTYYMKPEFLDVPIQRYISLDADA